MKKWLFLAILIMVGAVLLLHRPAVQHTAHITEVPVEKPTTPLTVTTPDQPATTDQPATVAAPAYSSQTGTPLLDAKSSDYPSGTVISQPFKPTTFWTWNVDYTCSAQTQTTKLPSGNYQTTGPNLVVYLMIYVPQSNGVQDADIYHLVQSEDASGSYSVTETADETFYFRVSGNCDWHITANDNGAPLYTVVEPCTTNEQAEVGPVPASCGR